MKLAKTSFSTCYGYFCSAWLRFIEKSQRWSKRRRRHISYLSAINMTINKKMFFNCSIKNMYFYVEQRLERFRLSLMYCPSSQSNPPSYKQTLPLLQDSFSILYRRPSGFSQTENRHIGKCRLIMPSPRQRNLFSHFAYLKNNSHLMK